MNDLRLAFRNFLERAQDESWITTYDWYTEESFGKLRAKMAAENLPEISKSHKKASDGRWWGVKVESFEDNAIGIDLEIMVERPILKNPEWLSERLGISRSSTSKQLLEEWSCREAAFKCLAPDNQGLTLPLIRKASATTYYVEGQTEKSIQTRLMWRDNWLLVLAWRSRT